jgi:hypothetical protein
VQELRPGLWSWTAPHPDWTEGEEWGPDVRSYAYDSGACLVLFDPISPPSLVEGLIEAQEVGVVLTAEWHRRSADECVERYGAHLFSFDEEPPADVVRVPTDYDAEVAYWLPRHRALVVGDSFTAEDEFRLQDGWLPPGVTREQMVAGLAPLLELPVQHVLVSHGNPILENGSALLREALTT